MSLHRLNISIFESDHSLMSRIRSLHTNMKMKKAIIQELMKKEITRILQDLLKRAAVISQYL